MAAAKKPQPWRLIIKTIVAFGMLTFVAQLFLSLAALIYGTTIVLPEILDARAGLYIIAPVLIELVVISGDALGAYYIFLVAAIFASATWLFLSSGKGYAKELGMKAESRRHSALFEVCGLMFATTFVSYAVVLVVGVVWGDPSDPTVDQSLWQLLFLLANASVWEEIVGRVLLIGIPLLVVDLVRRKAQPKKYRYILGGGFNLGAAEIGLLVISSAMFGYAHYDGGWGAWKILPSAVGGLAFGYLFLRHGLASAIMLHFGVDYLLMPTEVFTDGSGLGALVLLGFALILWLAMGAVFFTYYVTRMIEFVTKEKYFEGVRPAPAAYPSYYTYRYVPPAQQWQAPQQPDNQWQGQKGPREGPAVSPAPPGFGGFFVCPVCGHTGARWMEGKFQCLRCGAVV